MKRRNLAILCSMALTMSVVAGFTNISQAAPAANCSVAELTAEPTPPSAQGGPLLVAGTHVSWGANCVGNTTELPAALEIFDPYGNLLAEVSSTLSGTGNLASSNDILVPVQTGHSVCLTLPTDRHCVKI